MRGRPLGDSSLLSGEIERHFLTEAEQTIQMLCVHPDEERDFIGWFAASAKTSQRYDRCLRCKGVLVDGVLES